MCTVLVKVVATGTMETDKIISMAVTIVVVMATVVCANSEDKFTSSVWQRLPGDASVTMTYVTCARSRSQCAAQCYRSAEARCVTFCKSVTSHDCYLAVEVTSAVNVLPTDVDVNCYRKGLTSELPPGYDEFDRKYMKAYTDTMPFENATLQCQADGAHLLYYKSIVWYQAALQQLLQGHAGSSYLVGATDVTSEGTFTWGDGTPVSDDVWHGGEPNNANGNEDCVILYTGNIRMNDIPCGSSFPFICELEF